MITKSVVILENLKHKSGLFSASKKSVKTGYSLAWIRDNIYETMGLETTNIKSALPTYWALLNIFLKHEAKIDWAIQNKPKEAYQYIHARYNPENLEEIWEPWGNKQNDAIGLFLFKIGDLLDKDLNVLRNEDDKRIIQKLIDYLGSVEYWHDKDNGVWEEYEEIHASSVGACLAGLKKISRYFNVKQEMIDKGQEALDIILPKESETKEVDLALLTLIWPFDIVNEEQRNQILKNVENKLLRDKGVIRYNGDKYYMTNDLEAEWCFGLVWLAIIYKQLNNFGKYKDYMKKVFEVINENGELPELYYGRTQIANENTPLGWGQALMIVALS